MFTSGKRSSLFCGIVKDKEKKFCNIETGSIGRIWTLLRSKGDSLSSCDLQNSIYICVYVCMRVCVCVCASVCVLTHVYMKTINITQSEREFRAYTLKLYYIYARIYIMHT